MISKLLLKLKEDFMKTPYRVYITFLILLLVTCFAAVACVSVGPSRNYVERDVKNADELLPLLISLVENATQDQLVKSVKEELKQDLQNATSNGLDLYKMGLIRKAKNWHFLINSENAILQKHDKKSE